VLGVLKRNVRKLIEVIKARSVDEDRVFVYELRREYLKDFYD
jgi:hypothetical protein